MPLQRNIVYDFVTEKQYLSEKLIFSVVFLKNYGMSFLGVDGKGRGGVRNVLFIQNVLNRCSTANLNKLNRMLLMYVICMLQSHFWFL